MRVHLVTDQLSTGGGLEHMYQIVRGMPDIQFGLFGQAGSGAGRFDNLDNVKICDRGFAPALVLQQKPDLVHIHHLRPLLSFFQNPLRRYKVPILFTAHGLHIHKYEFMPGLKARLKYLLRFCLEKYLFRRPDRIVAVSREDHGFLEVRYLLNNVGYLTNGIDAAGIGSATLTRKQLRQKLQLPAGAFLFVTVARFDFQKGYDILLEAVRAIKPFIEKRGVRFVWVGEGDEFDRLRQKADEWSVSKHIDFLGERQDVYDIIRAADVFLLPSRWEGLPIVLLEAGLLKTPVLASATYGNREIIGQTNGVLFDNLSVPDLTDKIKRIVNNDYALSARAANLHIEIQHHYTLQNMLTGLRHIYHTLPD
jgi:glycosyltransferase involved in cell wall biosynthesis